MIAWVDLRMRSLLREELDRAREAMAAGGGVQFEHFDSSGVAAFLKSNIPTISEGILKTVVEQKIDGEVFLALDDGGMREIAPLLGDRVKIKKALDIFRAKAKETSSVVPCLIDESKDIGSDSDSSSAAGSDEEIDSSFFRKRHSVIISDSEEEIGPSKIPRVDLKKRKHATECKDKPVTSVNDCEIISHKPSIKEEMSGKLDSSTIRIKTEGSSCKLERSQMDWADKLSIPTRFSAKTTSCIKSGTLSKSARDEIIQSLATLILVHTSQPQPEDHTIICKKLVEKYPTLKDKVDGGFGSWRTKLLMKFKNLRRPARAEKAGIVVQPPSTAAKKSMGLLQIVEPSASDKAEYERHVEFLRTKYESKKWSVPSMLTLLQQTSNQRQMWIKNDKPTVKMVLEKFPCLADSKIMLKEFCRQTNADESTIRQRWTKIEQQIFEYAPLEGKKVVKDLLVQYTASDDVNADRTTTYAILLLSACLVRKKAQANLLTVFEGDAIDVEEALKSHQVRAPSVVAFGSTKDSPSDIKVVIESDNVMPMPSMVDALNYCFSSYYIFDISFPPDFHLVMLFLEKYVYGLKPSQKLPLSVSILYDSLQKTTVES